MSAINGILEENAELIEYQQVAIRAYEVLVSTLQPHLKLMHCVTCNLPVNESTAEEFDSLIFVCDECGLLPWCGRTACKEPQLNDYEVGTERTLCVACANEIFKQ